MTLPLYIFFLGVEPVSKNILPATSFVKTLAFPITYSFPLNLAQLTNFYPNFQLNYVNILLFLFSLFSLAILIVSLRLKNKPGFLWVCFVGAPLVTAIFSLLITPAFGLRSLLIFSPPFYVLLAASLSSLAKALSRFYVSFAGILVFLLLITFVMRPIPAGEFFIDQNIPKGSLTLHTEFTTYTYYSYLFSELENKAAIDSLYVNNANKRVLGYIPVDLGTLSQKRFWLIEYSSEIHKQQVANFRKEILKTHKQVDMENFGQTKIYRYEPK